MAKTTADDDQQQKTVLYNYDESIEVISQSLQTATMEVNIYADYSTPSITVGVDAVRKALVQLKDRGVKLRYITEITSNNLPYCKELADFAELRHIDKLIGSQLLTEKEFIAGAFLQATIAYSNVKEIVDQQKCMFDTIWNIAVPGEQKIKEIQQGVAETHETKVLQGANLISSQIEKLHNESSIISICSEIGGMHLIYDSFFNLYKKILEKYKRGEHKGIRWVCFIDRDSIDIVKTFLNLGMQIRHVETLPPMNFAVSDCLLNATIEKMEGGKMVQTLLTSNEHLYVNHFNFIFDRLWSNSINAEDRIRDIENGLDLTGTIEIIYDPHRAENLYKNLIENAKHQILIILPSNNAFFRQEKIGIMSILKAVKERGVEVRMIISSGDLILIEKQYSKTYNIDIRLIQESSGNRATFLIIDRKVSLVIETKYDSKTSFTHAIGLSIHSSSKAAVSSYIAIFENLWSQNKFGQTRTAEISKLDFLSIISHELKTPIVPMKMYSEMLLHTESLGLINEKQKKAIQTIHRNIEKLEVLVNDVMDVYKLDMGKVRFSKVDVDIDDLVNQTISELKPLTIDKQVELKPDIRTTGKVFCDPKRIEQVLSNLIKNSIDFVPSKNGKIIVRAEKGEDSKAIFTVEDNGIGIKQEKASKLFQKFYQIDTSATRKHGGTGLGLAICKGIVEAHGGNIWVDEKYTNGAAIKFTLPSNN